MSETLGAAASERNWGLTWKALTSAGMRLGLPSAYMDRRSIMLSRMVRTLTFSFSSVHVCRKASRVARWNSSGKTWIMQSMR